MRSTHVSAHGGRRGRVTRTEVHALASSPGGVARASLHLRNASVTASSQLVANLSRLGTNASPGRTVPTHGGPGFRDEVRAYVRSSPGGQSVDLVSFSVPAR